MSVIAVTRQFLRDTEADTVYPTAKLSIPAAEAATIGQNAANAAIYTAAAVSGPAVPLLAALGKLTAGALLCGAGYVTNRVRGSDAGTTPLSLGVSLARSGGENLLVGALSAIPGYGSWIAGTMAVRSAADIANVVVREER